MSCSVFYNLTELKGRGWVEVRIGGNMHQWTSSQQQNFLFLQKQKGSNYLKYEIYEHVSTVSMVHALYMCHVICSNCLNSMVLAVTEVKLLMQLKFCWYKQCFLLLRFFKQGVMFLDECFNYSFQLVLIALINSKTTVVIIHMNDPRQATME